jgi:hypothetical protein
MFSPWELVDYELPLLAPERGSLELVTFTTQPVPRLAEPKEITLIPS